MMNHSAMPRTAEQNEALREARKAQLIAAATARFAERGIDATNMQEVAEEAGCSSGLAYRYFPSKDALVRACLAPSLERPLAVVEEVTDLRGDSLLRHLSKRLLLDAQAHTRAYRLFFASLLQPSLERLLRDLRAQLAPRQRQLEERVEGAFRELGSDDPAADAASFRAQLGGLALAACRGEALDPEAATASLLRGLGASAPRPVALPRVVAATAADHPDLVRLYPELGVPEPPPDAAAFARDLASYRVARVGGAVRGYARSELEGELVLLRELVTDPTARRQGIARRLIEAVAREAAAAGSRHLRLHVKADNTDAIALYERLGFGTDKRGVALEIEDPTLPLLPRYTGRVRALAPGDAEELASALDLDAAALRDARRIAFVAENNAGGLDGVAVGKDRLGPLGARTRSALAALVRHARAEVVLLGDHRRETRWLESGGARRRFELLTMSARLPL
jgi:AcrR family transcriptional regulator/N-acetylglutamate synthase-like GNAT family acetyltransferase